MSLLFNSFYPRSLLDVTGISQGNRKLIESAMAHAKTELNAVSISLCQNGKSVLELPPAANRCAATGSAGLFEERLPILGSSDFVAQVSISFFREFRLQFCVIIAAFALLVSVSILFIRASRALLRDLVSPLQLNLADEAGWFLIGCVWTGGISGCEKLTAVGSGG